MAFSDHQLQPNHRKTAVERIEEYLNGLPDNERGAALNILNTWPHTQVLHAFEAEGFPITKDNLKQWRATRVVRG